MASVAVLRRRLPGLHPLDEDEPFALGQRPNGPETAGLERRRRVERRARLARAPAARQVRCAAACR